MNMFCRHSRGLIVAALVCAGVGTTGAQKRSSAVPSSPSDKSIVHVLNRIGFGPAPGDLERVRRIGLAAYVEQQLQPDRLSDEKVEARLAGFSTLKLSTQEIAQNYYLPAQRARRQAQRTKAGDPAMTPGMPAVTGMTPDKPGVEGKDRTLEERKAAQAERVVLAELMQQKVLRAAYSEKQLQEVMVDFWFNHFNVFAGKGPTRIYLTEYERDTVRPRVFGKFRDLLGAVAEAPAMLFYLDNWQSSAPEGTGMEQQDGRRPQQQRRGAMRGRGVNENYARELMELHTLGVDGGYTQKDVQEIARAFTGWTLSQPRQGGRFRFEPRMHDNGEKTVLGMHLKKGGGKKDGEQVLDLLAKHPSTATFVATKLARRFVSDNPPKALVERAASRFRETDGDIREVVRAIITSPEFFDTAADRAKVKSPFEFVASAIRATGADAVNALSLVQTLRELGMPLYGAQPPTGYADRADAWVNTGALLNRMNFAVALSSGKLRGVTSTAATSRQWIAAGALAGDVSEPTRATVARATEPAQAVALLLGSPEFQRK